MDSTRLDGTHRGAALAGIAFLLMAGSVFACQRASAQTSAPAIDLVVPTAAQGSTDLLARMVAEGLARRGFGDVRVRNVPGRSGTLAAARVATAPPDGRTLLVATPSSHGIASAFEASMPYDPVAGFTPILRFAEAPYVLVVAPGGASTLPQFVAGARAARGAWRYASTGTGGPHHLVAEFYFQRAGLTLQHVPADGGAAALGMLADGRVEAMLPAAILALPQIESGRLEALAVTGSRRLQSLPDVPTFGETGIPVDVVSWYGLMAPPGLPEAQARRLADAVQAITSEPEFEARLARMAATRTADVGPEFARIVAAEVGRWRGLTRELGIGTDAKEN